VCIVEAQREPNTARQGFRGQSALASHGRQRRQRWHCTITSTYSRSSTKSVDLFIYLTIYLFTTMCIVAVIGQLRSLTNETVVVIREPPAPPPTNTTLPAASRTIVGHMDDMGIFPGSMKLLADGGKPKALTSPGVEKSSISSLNMIPVRRPRTFAPNLTPASTHRNVAN